MIEGVFRTEFDGDKVIIFIPKEWRREVYKEIKSGFSTVKFSKPRRMRSVGRGSQNHHLNGHIAQIAAATGNSHEAVKIYLKMMAAKDMGFPFETFKGQIIPKNEKDCDASECSILIEAAHLLAADLGITLQE